MSNILTTSGTSGSTPYYTSGTISPGVLTSSNTGQYTINASGYITCNLSVGQSAITFYKDNGNSEIVSISKDGVVTWANGIDIDEAAEAFSKSISIGAEIQAGITRSVKHKMRDSIFADLIEFAKEKGSLTADDLTYLLKASKIIEKLKGGRD
jgi:hypothetical protein